MTYDPWHDNNRAHWAKPIQQALEHADEVLRPHGLRLDVSLEVVPLAADDPGESPGQVISATGNFCDCGGPMVQTGSCETCQWCGESSGGCG